MYEECALLFDGSTMSSCCRRCVLLALLDVVELHNVASYVNARLDAPANAHNTPIMTEAKIAGYSCICDFISFVATTFDWNVCFAEPLRSNAFSLRSILHI